MKAKVLRPFRQASYQCRYCRKPFIHESRLLAHKCKRMKREEEFRTNTGQRAWELYRVWFACSNKRVINAESFLESRYYSSFVRFAKYIRDIGIPHPEEFIKLMVKKDYMPSMWTSSEIYSIYLQDYDNQISPQSQVSDSIDTIDKICEAREIETKDFFESSTPAEIINLLRKKKISPWLLLRSKKFIEAHDRKFTQEHKQIIRTFIKIPLWKRRFKEKRKFVLSVVDQLVKDMGL